MAVRCLNSKDDLAVRRSFAGLGNSPGHEHPKVTNDDMRHNCKMPLSGARSGALQRGSTCVPVALITQMLVVQVHLGRCLDICSDAVSFPYQLRVQKTHPVIRNLLAALMIG